MKIRALPSLIPAAALAAAALAAPAHAQGLSVGASLGTPRYQDPVGGVSGNGSGLRG